MNFIRTIAGLALVFVGLGLGLIAVSGIVGMIAGFVPARLEMVGLALLFLIGSCVITIPSIDLARDSFNEMSTRLQNIFFGMYAAPFGIFMFHLGISRLDAWEGWMITGFGTFFSVFGFILLFHTPPKIVFVQVGVKENMGRARPVHTVDIIEGVPYRVIST